MFPSIIKHLYGEYFIMLLGDCLCLPAPSSSASLPAACFAVGSFIPLADFSPPVSSFIQKVVAFRIKVETIFRPHIHFQDTFHSFCRFPFCCSVCCCGCVFMWCCNMLYYFAKPTLKLYSWPPPVCLWLSDIRTLIGWSSKHPASHPTVQINSEYKLPLRFLPPSPTSPSPAPRL